VLRVTVVFLAVACLTDWVLIEDLGFFGGLGTDPKSMIPLLLLVVGYLALTPAPAAAPAEGMAPALAAAPASDAAADPAAGIGWRERFRPASLCRAISATSARSVVSATAVGIVLLGATVGIGGQAAPRSTAVTCPAIARYTVLVMAGRLAG
jgi:hypothetical protein